MKKAVPLALLLATSNVMGTTLDGSWTAGAAPTSGANAARCCYLKAGTALTIAGTALNGIVDASGQTTSTGACKNYIATTGKQIVSTTASATSAFTDTLASSPVVSGASTTVNNASPGAPAAGNNGLTVTSPDSGVTLSFLPADNDATNGVACTAQTFTRGTVAVPTGVASSKYTAAAGSYSGSGTNNCCFFDTTEQVAVTVGTTDPKKVTVSGKLGGTSTQCATTGSSPTYTLKAGSDANTFKSLDDVQTYTLVDSGKTITFKPTTDCTQTLTVVASSSASKLAVMTPVVVGAAVLGLAVL